VDYSIGSELTLLGGPAGRGKLITGSAYRFWRRPGDRVVGHALLAGAVKEKLVMADFGTEIDGYLTWMTVHNYAATTIEDRRRYLGYFSEFARSAGIVDVRGHEKVRTYGHEKSALMATKSPRFWPREVRTPR